MGLHLDAVARGTTLKIRVASMMLAFLTATGCTGVQTTRPGVLGIDRTQYMFSALPAKDLERQYSLQYSAGLQKAAAAGLLVTDSTMGREMQRIAGRLITQSFILRRDAKGWPWAANLINADILNANCGPGGKIIVYTGLIKRLQLTDDELAMVLGHEIAHALREHGREQASAGAVFELAGGVGANLSKTGALGKSAITSALGAGVGRPFSRRDESEADLIGLELAARAGYDPRASISLWKKMAAAGAASKLPTFLSTHPSGDDRIASLEEAIPKVLPLYTEAVRK